MGNRLGTQQMDNVGRARNQEMDVEDQEYPPLIMHMENRFSGFNNENQQQDGVLTAGGVNQQQYRGVNQQDGDEVVAKHVFIRLWEAIIKLFRKLFTRVAPEPPQDGNPPDAGENQQDGVVAKHVFNRLWEAIIKLVRKLFTRVAQEPPQGGNPRNYTEGIMTALPGFKIEIKGPSDLKPFADLVKEKAELVKYVESIYKSGRDYRHNIILTFVGTMLVGILNAIVDGFLADHISLGVRILVLGIFSFSFIVYLGGAIYELDSIYQPSLTDANSSHSIIIRSMNVNRDALMKKEGEIEAKIELQGLSDEAEIELQGLSDEAEIELQHKEGEINAAEIELQLMLEDYCKKIIHPLPIRRQKTISFIMMGSMVVALVFAGILKAAFSLSGSPFPSPGPAPYFG